MERISHPEKNCNKSLHFVMARWTSKDNDMSRKTLELECNISKEEEEDNGYCSNKGYNLLSKMWSREETDKEKRNKGIDMDRTDKASRGNGNDEEEMRDSGDEVHGRSFLLLRNRLDKGQQNMGIRQRGQGVLQGETLDYRERKEVGKNKNLSDESMN